MTIWYTIEADGPVDREALRESMRLLRLEHPVLDGRFVPGSGGEKAGLPDLDLVAPAGSEIVIRENREGSVFADHNEALSFLDITHQDGHTLVSFAVHHAIADGRLGAYWHRRLWSLYTDLVEGVRPTVEPHPLPSAPETALAERNVARASSGSDRLGCAEPTDLPQPANVVFARERIKLSGAQTKRLHERARALGISVHALLCGICSVVERRRMRLPEHFAVPLCIDTPVDLRERLDPPAQAWDITNALGTSAGLVCVLPGSDPFTLGKQLLEQLREDLKSGAVYESLLRFAELLVADQPNIPRITATNMGVMESVRTPQCLRVHDFKGWVEFDSSAIANYMSALGSSTSNRSSSIYLIYTYEGRLAIEFGLQRGEETARAHAAELEALILDAI
ncbi:phthiocerol/phthiodiolone dimycocerosyl transferase family protein [Segniliparus rotundus]|nr:hypothetical protein [Segniliparus rotundus]